MDLNSTSNVIGAGNQYSRDLRYKTYMKYSDELRNWIQHRFNKGPQESEDIVQHTFLHFLSVAEPHKIRNTRAFLYKTAKNLLIDNSRRTSVQDNYIQAVAESVRFIDFSAEEVYMNREKLIILQKIIEDLPSKQRHVFILNRFHHLTYAAIASELGISTEAVKKHIMRALKVCQERMNEIFKDY